MRHNVGKHRVRVGSSLSDLLEILLGVPQGCPWAFTFQHLYQRFIICSPGEHLQL